MNYFDKYRIQHNYYTLNEINEYIAPNNIVFDPFSLLISKNVRIGKNNVFYSGVIIESDKNSLLEIGNNNTFLNNVILMARNGGTIKIGNNNYYDSGPISIKSNFKDSKIIFCDNGRYDGKINIYGICYFGNGAQILGNITVYNCRLESGKSFLDNNPDERAGLLKGCGTAKELFVPKGKVINGWNIFLQTQLENQSCYHQTDKNKLKNINKDKNDSR